MASITADHAAAPDDRPSADDLRRDLREVFARVRPDWDLGAPGLREEWESGDRSRFYPYRPATVLHERGA